MSKAALQKGKDLEQHLVNQLIEKGLDTRAQRSRGSGNGNGEKSDCWTSLQVLGQNAGFECKNHKKLSIGEWWKQTKKLESLGREPVLVYKLPYNPYSGTLVTIYLDTFLELVKAAREPTEIKEVMPQTEDREKRYALENLKSAITKAIKHLD